MRHFIAPIHFQPFAGLFYREALTMAVQPRQCLLRAMKSFRFDRKYFLCCLSFSDAGRLSFRFSMFMSVMMNPQN